MTTQRTDHTPHHPDAAHTNECRVQTVVDDCALPVGTLTARVEGVYATTDIVHDLVPWRATLGGTVTVTPVGSNLEVWTLHTHTPPLTGGQRTSIWVSCTAPAGELVDDDLRGGAITPSAPVDGPWRIGVTTLPTGAGLDVSHYLTGFVTRLAQAAEEDPKSLLAQLLEIAALARSAGAQGSDSHAAHERDERVDDLLAEVAGEGVLPVYGQQVSLLARRLLAVRESLAPGCPQRCPECNGTLETCTCGTSPIPPMEPVTVAA